jgi:23S rRNA (uracil1939-C5)-methyltransferase
VTADGRAGHRARHEPLAIQTDSCLATHPLLEELIVDGRYPGAGEVLIRVGVASGERLVQVRAGIANVQVPAGVLVVEQGDGREAYVHEDVAGRRFRVSAGSFFQSGPVAAEGLVAAVTEVTANSLPDGGHLVDAYAGVGLFASALGATHRGARVTAIESDRTAVADARVNLADLDARVVASEVGRWRPTGRKTTPVDVVVADPARSGLGKPGVATIAALDPTRLVLVSCDPASLGRDVALLATAGYRLTSITMVDAFPHTFHVETVSGFDRA